MSRRRETAGAGRGLILSVVIWMLVTWVVYFGKSQAMNIYDNALFGYT